MTERQITRVMRDFGIGREDAVIVLEWLTDNDPLPDLRHTDLKQDVLRDKGEL